MFIRRFVLTDRPIISEILAAISLVRMVSAQTHSVRPIISDGKTDRLIQIVLYWCRKTTRITYLA